MAPSRAPTDPCIRALEGAADLAVLAPSVHNTQPWRMVIRANLLELYADRDRQLGALDPTGRQLLVSCGCALLNARVVLAEASQRVGIDRFPEAAQPDLLARIRVYEDGEPWSPLARLEPQLGRRRTNRREFLPEEVPPDVIYEMANAAAAEDAELFIIASDEQRRITAELCQQAERDQLTSPAYRAELRAWTTDDLTRDDGVPAMAVPHVAAGSGGDIPFRDFDTRGNAWLPQVRESSRDQCLLLLGVREDSPRGWLRAGEALERIWLEATRFDHVASMLTQVVEVAETRDQLRDRLGLQMYPMVLLRVGRAPMTPATRRRPLDEVITEVVA
jgi:nitroreductase